MVKKIIKIGLIKLDRKNATIYKLGNRDEREIVEFTMEHKFDLGHRGHDAQIDISYLKEIEKSLKVFDGIIIASHGTGKSNEGEILKKHLETHDHILAEKIIKLIETDEHETENQLLAKADSLLELKHYKS